MERIFVAEIIMVVCLKCERRGPEWISFRLESNDQDRNLITLTAECQCGNREVIYRDKDARELEAMAEQKQQIDFSKLERFAV